MDNIWSEIRIDHFDDIENCWMVDAWVGQCEEGHVIAKIFLDGNVVYCDERVKISPYAMDEINNKLEEIRN